MRGRAVVLAVAAVLALVVASGAALADNMQGDAGGNRLVGTDGRDNISGAGGADDISGKGGRDRLFGASGNDDVYGGDQGDRLQAGMGQDDLFGQQGNDFVNVIDLQTNGRVDCGPGDDIVGIDDLFFVPDGGADFVAPNCESLYVGVLGSIPLAQGGAGPDLSSIDTRAEAEQAEADGLLRQIR